MSEPITFRVYPEPERRSLFVRVRVFATKRAMQRRVCAGRAYEAIVEPNDPRDRRRDRRLVATISVSRGQFCSTVMAHELLHAALIWASRVRLTLTQSVGGHLNGDHLSDEERLCYALQEMLEQCQLRALNGLTTEVW